MHQNNVYFLRMGLSVWGVKRPFPPYLSCCCFYVAGKVDNLQSDFHLPLLTYLLVSAGFLLPRTFSFWVPVSYIQVNSFKWKESNEKGKTKATH